MPISLLVATRKGAFVYRADSGRSKWRVEGPHFLGSIINHLVRDPRSGTLLMAAKAGHLGHTVFRWQNDGKTWEEAKAPPAFRKAAEGEAARAVDHIFCLVPANESGSWYAGTSPVGLFRSEDDGVTWQPVAGLNDGLLPKIQDKVESVPDGASLHSVAIDPRDSAHLYIGISTGGVFETNDGGETWRALNKGVAADFLPEKDPEYGHDPHALALHPLNPGRIYQQNHCGIYRLDRPGDIWRRIGESMPKEIGDIGFPLVLHPRDPDTLWVFPMDGTDVWPRVSPGGKPAAYMSRDGGESWQRQDAGLPQEHAWFTVKRQAFCADNENPLGLYFGTTSGEIWMSRNEGVQWQLLASHLPHIYALTVHN